MDLIKAFTNEQLKEEVPQFNIGDTVRVHNKIVEGTRERIQMYEGTVIAKHEGGISSTFTVRRIAYAMIFCGVLWFPAARFEQEPRRITVGAPNVRPSSSDRPMSRSPYSVEVLSR